jgi:hypothetical protein
MKFAVNERESLIEWTTCALNRESQVIFLNKVSTKQKIVFNRKESLLCQKSII